MRKIIQRPVQTTACSSLLLLSVLGAAGQGTLDQSFNPPPPNPGYLAGNILSAVNGTFIDQAQTFTVGIAGSLDQLQVLVSQGQSAGVDLQVDVRPTSGGVPVQDDSSALASAVVPASSVSGVLQWITVDFSHGISVLPGQQLAIVLRITGTGLYDQSYLWRGDSGDQYPAGSAYFRSLGGQGDGVWYMLNTPGVDWGFRTYVTTVPEPTVLGLLTAGALTGLLWSGYRGMRERC
jgi:hypothetical protein